MRISSSQFLRWGRGRGVAGLQSQFKCYSSMPSDYTPPPVAEVIASKLIGATCLFWMLYRFREEGAVWLVQVARLNLG